MMTNHIRSKTTNLSNQTGSFDVNHVVYTKDIEPSTEDLRNRKKVIKENKFFTADDNLVLLQNLLRYNSSTESDSATKSDTKQ